MEQFVIATPIGRYRIELTDKCVQSLAMTRSAATTPESPLAKQIQQSLIAYFNDPNQSLSKLPLCNAESDFQARFRQALCDIPLGSTRTYGELAATLHSSPRAIGQACRHNPLPIIIPCHRVVAKTNLGGYAGKTPANLDKKQWLLQHENYEYH